MIFSARNLANLVGVLFAFAIIAIPQMALAEYKFQSAPGLSVSGEYRTENILSEEPNDVVSQRNELKFDIDYERLMGGGGSGMRVDFHAQLRPFYDSVFDLDTGGMSENRELEKRWETNYDFRGDKRDPLLRELYFDVTAGNTDMRLGRQIIAWGKSDGIYMLDVINPFNFRNPFKFEEEDTKIPLWMANINQRVGADSTIQLIWSPFYTRAQYPGFRVAETVGGGAVAAQAFTFGAGPVSPTGSEPLRHAFAFKGIDFVNEFYQGFGYTVDVDKPDRLKDGMYGARWSSVIGDLNYTLNYLYTWSTFMGDFPAVGDSLFASTLIDRRPERMHVAGASWDYPLNVLPGPFQGMVWRGETAIFFNDLFTNADETSPNHFEPDKVTHHGLLMGFDQNFNIDLLPFISRAYLDPVWFVSVQYQQDWVLDPVRSKNAYFDFGAGAPNWSTYLLDGAEKGQRDDFKSQVTVSVLKDLLPGDVLHTEWFALYGFQSKDAWLRGKLRYEVTDDLNVAIGVNKFLGGKFDPFGQFKSSDHVFLELRYALF